MIYAQWGDRAKVLEWLDTAMRLLDSGLAFPKADPLMHPLRQEPRFQAAMRQLKVPYGIAARIHKIWPVGKRPNESNVPICCLYLYWYRYRYHKDSTNRFTRTNQVKAQPILIQRVSANHYGAGWQVAH